MNTSGVVIIAKTAHAQSFLQNLESADKRYIAFSNGIPKEDAFYIKKNIAFNEGELKRYVSENEGQTAKTYVEVVEKNEGLNICKLNIKLFTGRTHQIRVHLSSIGCPIIGDTLYGSASGFAKRQLLHCESMTILHPVTQESLTFKAELPYDMRF
jgi:23S rRNA pseudouridine1911/1915/1917 synthase